MYANGKQNATGMIVDNQTEISVRTHLWQLLVAGL